MGEGDSLDLSVLVLERLALVLDGDNLLIVSGSVDGLEQRNSVAIVDDNTPRLVVGLGDLFASEAINLILELKTNGIWLGFNGCTSF